MYASKKSDGEQKKCDPPPSYNAYMSAKPLFHLSQGVGLAPVTWPELRPSAGGVLYTCTIFAALLVWFLYTTALSVMHVYPAKDVTYIVSDVFNSSALYISSLASLVLCATVTRHKPQTVLRLVAQADEVVRAVCSSSVHNKTSLTVAAGLGVIVFFLTLLAVYDNFVWNGRLWNFHDYTGRYIAHLVNAVLVLQFSSLTLLLKKRFAKLNQILKSTVPSFNEARTHQAISETPAQTCGLPVTPVASLPRPRHDVLPVRVHPTSQHDTELLSLRKAHATLCEVASTVNGMFGVQILLVITSEFVGSVWLLYLLLVANRVEMADTSQQFVLWSLWLLYRFLKILLVVCSCHVAQAEGRRTGALVHQVMLQKELRGTGCSSSLMQLQLFSQQLLHSRDQMDFTACGLFPLDMSLLHSVVGAVTTYIIILLQFHAK